MGKPKPPKPKGYGKIAAPQPVVKDTNTEKIVFGFHYIVDGYDLGGASAVQAREFIVGLRNRSSKTWAEIIGMPRQGMGFEKIANLNVAIPAAVPQGCRDRIVCFRFGGLERFLGFRDRATFEVIWIDHGGQCYDHE